MYIYSTIMLPTALLLLEKCEKSMLISCMHC